MWKKLIVSGIVLSIVMFGCLSPAAGLEEEERDIQVEDLQNEDGIYMVEDLAWGSGMDETAESLKIRFPEEPSLSGEGIEIYHSEDPLLFEGKESFVEAEFHDGGLAALTFRISPGEGAKELYGDLSDRMKELYGDIEETQTPLGDATIGSYIWTDGGNGQTTLQITKMGEQVIVAAGTSGDAAKSGDESVTETKENALQFQDLRDSGGAYMVSGLPWGSSEEETAERLRVAFPEEPTLSGDGIDIYHPRGTVSLEDCEASVEAEFHDGGLAALTFRISPGEGAKELYGELSDRMKELYGDIEETQTPLGDATIGSYIWTDEQECVTVLQITGMGEQVIIAVGQNK